MDTHTKNRTKSKIPHLINECCSDNSCASESRNNYFLNKRLSPDTFRTEQTYHTERRKLINRAIHGWGVVFGYPVTKEKADPNCPDAKLDRLFIGEGLALDALGRELIQVDSVALTLKKVLVLNADGGLQKKPPSYDSGQCWRLNVHYAERSIGPVTVKDSCNCERTEWDKVCETVLYSIQPIDCKDCCSEQSCELNCDCESGPCCNETGKSVGGEVAESSHLHNRGGCRCLCDHLTDLKFDSECRSLYPINDCTRVDIKNSVALACVKLCQDDCGDWQFESVYDDCGPRRLVKRNDLLFDLIQGCDLTHIIEIGWHDWHRNTVSVKFDEFVKAFGDNDINGEEIEPKGSKSEEEGSISTKFWVEFSRPVRSETLRTDCFSITVILTEPESGWGMPFRVPIIDIVKEETSAGYVKKATLVVDFEWLEDAVGSTFSRFTAGEARVEIEVRGDFIIDCNGQAVDANARGLSAVPSGNGTPGDTFLSTFNVEMPPPSENKQKRVSRFRSGVKS
jgi:hypothetical protein